MATLAVTQIPAVVSVGFGYAKKLYKKKKNTKNYSITHLCVREQNISTPIYKSCPEDAHSSTWAIDYHFLSKLLHIPASQICSRKLLTSHLC